MSEEQTGMGNDDMRIVNSQIEFLLIEAGRHAGRWNADASKEREGSRPPGLSGAGEGS